MYEEEKWLVQINAYHGFGVLSRKGNLQGGCGSVASEAEETGGGSNGGGVCGRRWCTCNGGEEGTNSGVDGGDSSGEISSERDQEDTRWVFLKKNEMLAKHRMEYALERLLFAKSSIDCF